MKIAVTGASGFIGQYVIRELISRGIIPTLLLREESVPPTGSTQCRIVRFDLASFPENAFELIGKPDALIHLAWNGLPNYKSNHHFEKELPAQYQFLKNLVTAGLKKIVISGTCFEYGMKNGCLEESMTPIPENPYGLAKDTLRRQLMFLQEKEAFNLVWTRLFYLYGEGQAASSLYSQFREAVKRQEHEFPMSGGEQLRDYLPVEEAASALVSLTLDNDASGIYNICSGRPTSVRNLVEKWISKTGSPITTSLGRFPYPNYEPMAFWGDANKINNIIKKYEQQ